MDALKKWQLENKRELGRESQRNLPESKTKSPKDKWRTINITSLSHLSLKPTKKWTREVDRRNNSVCCRTEKKAALEGAVLKLRLHRELGRLTYPIPGCAPGPCREPSCWRAGADHNSSAPQAGRCPKRRNPGTQALLLLLNSPVG